MSRTAEYIINDPEMWNYDREPDCQTELCDACGLRMPVNMMTALFGVHFECGGKDIMQETIRLIVNKRIAVNIRDGASPHNSNFVVFEEGMEVDKATHIVITVKAEVWERVDKGQQNQSDIEAIAGQCEMQLGG